MRILGEHLNAASYSRWSPMCPYCGEKASRIERRWSDRLLNLFVQVRRYRCANGRCGWQGNLRS